MKALRLFLALAVLGLLIGVVARPLTPARAVDTNPGTTNLSACWDLDETSGVRYDWSANDNDLSDYNTVLYDTGIKSNAAWAQSANSEYLSINDNAYLSMGNIDFSIFGWFKFATIIDWSTILIKNTSGYAYQVQYNTSSKRLTFVISDGAGHTGTATANNFGELSTGNWYFFVGWYDSVNDLVGVQVNSSTPNTTANTYGSYDDSGALVIPRSTYFNGYIDELGIYKKVLTADERSWLYNSGSGRSCSELEPATNTPTPSNTASYTPSNTPTFTFTPSETPTHTFTPSQTYTPSQTPTDTPTPTETYTPSQTPTETFTPSMTFTPTDTLEWEMVHEVTMGDVYSINVFVIVGIILGALLIVVIILVLFRRRS